MSKESRRLEQLDEEEQRKLRGEAGNDVSSDDSEDENDDITRIDKMANEIDESIRRQAEYAMNVDRKEAKRQSKTKNIVELQRQKKMDESDDERLKNDDIMMTA